MSTVYFDCVQLIIGGLGHVTQHMRESTLHNQNKTTLGKARQIAVREREREIGDVQKVFFLQDVTSRIVKFIIPQPVDR